MPGERHSQIQRENASPALGREFSLSARELASNLSPDPQLGRCRVGGEQRGTKRPTKREGALLGQFLHDRWSRVITSVRVTESALPDAPSPQGHPVARPVERSSSRRLGTRGRALHL